MHLFQVSLNQMLELFVALMLWLALSVCSLLSGACLDMVDIPTAEVVFPCYTVALLFLTDNGE